MNSPVQFAKACGERQIKVLTVFELSSENWNCPANEVSGLMDLSAMSLTSAIRDLRENGFQLHFIEDRQQLSAEVRQAFEHGATTASTNQGVK